VGTIKRLRKEYDLVVGVEILEQENQKGLSLLGESLHFCIYAHYLPLLQQADQTSPLSLQSCTFFGSHSSRRSSFWMQMSCPSDLCLISLIFLTSSRLPQMLVGQIYLIRAFLLSLRATTSLMNFTSS
jgi:hypothetical protein